MTPYYQDPFVTIFHGECREIIPDLGKFDVVITDPPYGISYDTGHRIEGVTPWSGQIFCDQDTSARDETLDLIGDIPAIVFGSRKCNPPKGTRMVLVWDKGGGFGNGRTRPSLEAIQ